MSRDWIVGLFTLGRTALGGAFRTGFSGTLRIAVTLGEARSQNEPLLAAKRQIASEIHSLTVAVPAVTEGEDDELFRHLLVRRERRDQYGSVLADDDSYVTVSAAYTLAELVERTFDEIDPAERAAEAKDALAAVRAANDVLDPEKKPRRQLATVVRSDPG